MVHTMISNRSNRMLKRSMNWFAPAKFLHFLLFVSVFGDTVRSATLPIPVPVPGICKSVLEKYGYQCEEHTVTTEDGYILSLQRIPHGCTGATGGPQKIPVLLQHGAFMDGITWLLNSPADSLGYILADSGYDVWIINGRGTTYSRRHNTFSTRTSAYWDWTWDELAAYDLPATYDYVYNHSGRQKFHYVAHSLGTLMALASFSQMKLVNMTRSAVFLSPIAYLDQVKSSLAHFLARAYFAEALYTVGFNEFLPDEEFVHDLLKRLCKLASRTCFDLVSSLTGKNCCVNSSAINIFLEHEPQPTSTKNLIHLCQIDASEKICVIDLDDSYHLEQDLGVVLGNFGIGIAYMVLLIERRIYTFRRSAEMKTDPIIFGVVRRGTITKFDYENDDENVKHYGQSKPPSYDISDFPKDLPLFLVHGGEDGLSDVMDVEHLLERLKSHDADKLRVLYEPEYAHGDFIMGSNAKQIVYEPLVQFLESH